MSEEFYPLSGIEALSVNPLNRVETDEMEDGSETSRNLWADKMFKREIDLKHTPLTDQEAIVLRDFYTERNGSKDSFWFRDNVNRDGNYRVRFTGGTKYERMTAATKVDVTMRQIAATKARVTLPRIIAATGGIRDQVPFWFDADKSKHWIHNYSEQHEQNWFNAGALAGVDAVHQTQNLAAQVYVATDKFHNARIIGGTNAKYITANAIAKGDYIAPGSQARGLWFAMVKLPTHASKRVICGIGTVAALSAMGIAIAADNRIEPWLGGAETFTNARFNNSTANTWRSVAVAFEGSDCTLYVNGVSIGTDAIVGRTYVDGKLSLGCAPDGTLALTSGISYLQHAMLLSDDFDATVVANLHNLFAANFGLATV